MLTIEVREKVKNSTKDLKGEENLHKHAQAAILPTDAFKLQISAQKKAPRLGLVNILVQYVAQYPDTYNKNSIFEALFSVIGKQSISNES